MTHNEDFRYFGKCFRIIYYLCFPIELKMKKVKKILGTFIPKFGTFTNGPYRVKGVRIYRNLIGWVVESYYPMVYDIGKFVILSEYDFSDHEDFQYHK